MLRSAASPVTEFDDGSSAEAERMIGLMRDAIGVGLAATQLGILRRMLVFQVGSDGRADGPGQPRDRVALRGRLATAEEGCLSIPGVDRRRRAAALRQGARASTSHGEPLSVEASGLEARVIQHEVDHLDGVLMLDRAEREQKRKAALRALREGGTYAPDAPEDDDEPARASAAGSEDRLPRHHRVRGDGPPASGRQPAPPGPGGHPA